MLSGRKHSAAALIKAKLRACGGLDSATSPR